jgi:hypothetical protein
MERVIAVVRAGLTPYGRGWVHVLGAGWDAADVAQWRRCGPDSIDSIAYYTAALQGVCWAAPPVTGDWRLLAVINAVAALRMATATEGVNHAR